MPPENVEIARQMIECVDRADDEGLAALMAEDVECFPGDEQPEPPFRGREAFLRYARSWTEAFNQSFSNGASTWTSANTWSSSAEPLVAVVGAA